jgi:hypothetical protein
MGWRGVFCTARFSSISKGNVQVEMEMSHESVKDLLESNGREKWNEISILGSIEEIVLTCLMQNGVVC